MNKLPPRYMLRFFRWFCHPDLVNSIEGDLMELYQERLISDGKGKADIKFIKDVLLLFRPSIIRPAEGYQNLNNYGMFKNYLVIGVRNLLRQKMYSAIKVVGFAVGIAACLLITLFIRDELNYDLHYENGDDIYRVVSVAKEDGDLSKYVWMQGPFAKSVKEDFPEIIKAGRYNSSELHGAGSREIRTIDQSESTYEEGFVFMDQSLLEILQIPMVYGSRDNALKEPHSIVLTRRKAQKYFPNEEPIGKQVILSGDSEPYTVGGVIENFPGNTHIQFDFLITLEEKEFWPGEQDYWGSNNYPTYVQLASGTNPDDLENKMRAVVKKYLLPLWIKEGAVDAETRERNISFELQPIKDIYLRSDGINDPVSHGDIRFVWLFGGIAVFILIIACINFINLSTAKSANRAKEVGLRKAIGSHRGNIISQFLTESLLFSFLSFVLGIVLAWFLLPYFNLLAAKQISFPIVEWSFFPILIGASILVGLVSGIYPSFYLSSFNPIDVLKGKVSTGSRNASTRSVLVVFQFTTSIILIIATFIIYQQVEFILNKKIGFDKEHVILIQGTNTLEGNTSTFKAELLQLSQAQSVSVSDYLPIKGTKRNQNEFWNAGQRTVEKAISAQIWNVDHDYIKTMGMQLTAGRDFSEDMSTDSLSAVVNQSMVKSLGLENPIGKQITNGMDYTIIGVVEDFHFETLKEEIRPLCLVLGRNASIISVKANTAEMAGLLKSVENIWKKFLPGQAMRYSFLDESYARIYDDVQRMGRIFTTFAILAIIVACLGLFALSAFMVEQRGKEISIRLVLGASLNSIFNMLTFNFLKLVLISILIASPIAWYAMQGWLQDFTYRTEITWQVFVASGIMAVVISLLTISYQSIKAAMASPVEGLKAE